MNTAVINIKTEPETKAEAQRVAKELGVSVSSLINSFLKELIRTKQITLRADEKLNKQTLKAIKKAREERKKSLASPVFDNAEDAISWLHKKHI